MPRRIAFLAGLLVPLLAACSPGGSVGLGALVQAGNELHPALATPVLDEHPIRHVRREVLDDNPQHSSDPGFVEAISRSASQGRLGGEGFLSALYALYVEDRELGFYGLEAESEAAADRREAALRDIWAVNVGLDRARIHRGGRILVVIWTDGVSPECWKAVNEGVAEQLKSP